MKKLIGTAIAGLALCLAAGMTPAQAADAPDVASCTPFTADCNYMSQAGYLRYLVFEQQGQWLTRQDAVALVINHGTGMGD